MLEALKAAETNDQIAREYQTKLIPLIYGTKKPNFTDAFKVFKRSAQQLIASL
jgi:hypothetical protein